VEIPGVRDPEEAIATIRETGMLEFVHMGMNPLPEGTVVTTDFAQPSEAETQPTPTADPAAPPASDQVLHTVMTGEVLKTVQVATDQAGRYVIEFTLTSEGSRTFADYTSQNIGQFLGIVLDKEVISAPRVESAITEGSGIISGSFTLESANALAVQLRYGSLPIPLKVVESRIIGPTLGQDSLQKSLLAGVIGFYGFPTGPSRNDSAAPADVADRYRSAVLALYGGADQGIPPEAIETFDQALERAGIAHESVTYPGAPHSFFDRKQEEHAEASADAWRRMLSFIARHAGPPSA